MSGDPAPGGMTPEGVVPEYGGSACGQVDGSGTIGEVGTIGGVGLMGDDWVEGEGDPACGRMTGEDGRMTLDNDGMTGGAAQESRSTVTGSASAAVWWGSIWERSR